VGSDTVASASILWVRGSPGWGKTVLAASVVDELRLGYYQDCGSTPLVCYYFFKQDASRKVELKDAYRALAAQIYQQCHQLEAIRNIFALAVNENATKASEQELRDLLQLCVSKLSHIYFIFDGIDECADDGTLLKLVRSLTALSDVKVILFSRPNVSSLYCSIADSHVITLQKSILNDDIAAFLDNAISELICSGKIPEDSNVESLREHFTPSRGRNVSLGQVNDEISQLPSLITSATGCRDCSNESGRPGRHVSQDFAPYYVSGFC
jgi:hypothetical protein